MRLDKSSIKYMSRVRGIAQWMHDVKIDHIIPLFVIASLDYDSYPGVKSNYLAGYTTRVNCDLLQLSVLLSIEETRQHTLVIPDIPLSTPSFNRLSNRQNNTENECPGPPPHQPTTQSSNITHPSPLHYKLNKRLHSTTRSYSQYQSPDTKPWRPNTHLQWLQWSILIGLRRRPSVWVNGWY